MEGSSRSALALALTFLLIGIGYGCPWPIVRTYPDGIWPGALAQEVLNLYALVSFLGLAHFFYAFRGQKNGLAPLRAKRRAIYILCLAVIVLILIGVRSWIGVGAFSLLIWVYNISHFMKAESHFGGVKRNRNFYAPAIAFAWFTLALFQVGPLKSNTVTIAGTVIIATVCLCIADWKTLSSGEMRLPLLTYLFLGETFIWHAYSPYMSDAFRVGIYIFHIAAASFYHYLGAYFWASNRKDPFLTMRSIVAINIAFIALGVVQDRWLPDSPLRFITSPAWFTVWVALHLASSDLLPWWKTQTR